MPEIVAALLVPLSILLFFPLWLGAMWLTAKLGGWEKLASVYGIEQYPARPRQKGGFQTIFINRGRYKNSVDVDFDEDGLYLYPTLLFRFRHSLLYIPWEDVTVHPSAVSQGLLPRFATHRLTFAKAPDVRIVFPKRLIEKFERYRNVKMMDS